MFCFDIFFFKQKTAYEMRISDWSSDVCSSDLDELCFGHGEFPLSTMDRRQPSILEKSATLCTASRKRASSPRRDVRISASGSLTITPSKKASIGARSEASAVMASVKRSSATAAAAAGSAASSAARRDRKSTRLNSSH